MIEINMSIILAIIIQESVLSTLVVYFHFSLARLKVTVNWKLFFRTEGHILIFEKGVFVQYKMYLHIRVVQV